MHDCFLPTLVFFPNLILHVFVITFSQYHTLFAHIGGQQETIGSNYIAAALLILQNKTILPRQCGKIKLHKVMVILVLEIGYRSI